MASTTHVLVASLFAFIFALLALWHFWRISQEHGVKQGQSQVRKHFRNPIMSPDTWNAWEQVGTFNPAALQDEKGRVHLLYRAIGTDGISRIGYASSKDGLHFDDRSQFPVYSMINPRRNTPNELQKHDPIMYPSGGSWGGAEDPRLISIGDKIYMSFNAFDGWDYVRIAVVSINKQDFYAKRWRWTRPLFISPKGMVNKNWVIFPEKINGKFAILHSMTPDVQIDYVDRLEELDYGMTEIRSVFGHKQPRQAWDTWVRGAGPPPIKTDKGWLVLYHAMDKKDPHIGYKLGAMLLNLENPRKVIARSPTPILTPSEWYENDWKPGVVYACGATVKQGMLYVYYGGGDKHVGVAHVPLEKLLEWLLKYGKV
jgi:predicted GH43/DUF377 family glycosyl hydrolase